MGIIKTAMLMGGGMYAVNKISKGYQQNQAQRPQQQQQYYNNPQQSSNQGSQQQQRAPQQQRSVSPMEFTDRRGNPQETQTQQPQYLLTDNSNAPVPNYGYNQDGYYYETDSRAQRASSPMYASAGGPPQYQQYRGQPQRGYVEDDDVLTEADYQQNRGMGGGSGGSAQLLNTLMQQAQGMSGGKGKDFLSKLMK